MKRLTAIAVIFGFGLFISLFMAPPSAIAAPASSPVYTDKGFYEGEKGLSPSERAGREIWYKATAGNDRFHTYVFQQRLGVLIDWYRVLRTDERDDRFNAWGMINDPGCCAPGSPGCPAKSPEETFGFDWCPGDEELLKHVGKSDYRDPACDFKDASVAADDPHGPDDKRQSPCDLKFGTSTGVMGLRKFPNPKFNMDRWRKLNNGALGAWAGYDKRLSENKTSSDSQVSRLADGSIEPPFLVGMACGACHIAFDPLHPPKNPAHPDWKNIRGVIGNQYSRLSEIMVSGMSTNTLEWQLFSHARPGTTDTSAVPTDQVSNPGTMNALINLKQRPTFANEVVNKWRPMKEAECTAGAANGTCWCEPGKKDKCWLKSTEKQTVHHILKDGSDSIGAREALQRVYINIGSCSEQCWVNHLTDLRQLDPDQRNYGQTPVNIGQCRRDCPNFRAIEDRLGNIFDFLTSREATSTDLYVAKGLKDVGDLVEHLDKEFGKGAVARGKAVFAENCARCHSTQSPPFETRDFRVVSAPTGLRADWLGNDQATPASEVGTIDCRALHSNHMAGHVWQEYASETYRARPPDQNLPDRNGGGRGYYRNLSLLDVWAHAPFLHNNALGPELCGTPRNANNNFYRSPYVGKDGQALANPPACAPYDPSVQGRFNLYRASMESLLNPQDRVPKITRLDQPVVFDIGPKLVRGGEEKRLFGFTLQLDAGMPSGLFGSFQHKELFRDLVLSVADPGKLKERLAQRVPANEMEKTAQELQAMVKEILEDPVQVVQVAGKRLTTLVRLYSSCRALEENAGHRFGESLSPQDKKALTAFLATL